MTDEEASTIDQYEVNFELTKQYAQEKLLKDGNCVNQVLLGWDSGTTTVVVFSNYDDDIRELMPAIFAKAILKVISSGDENTEPDWFVQMSEAWMAKRGMEDVDIPKKGLPKNIGVRPSEDPNREEALVIAGGHRDGRNRLWSATIHRKPHLNLDEPSDEITTDSDGSIRSRVASILWDDDNEEANPDAAAVLSIIDSRIGSNPSDEACLRLAAGWLKAQLNSPLFLRMPLNVKAAFTKASDLMLERSENNER